MSPTKNQKPSPQMSTLDTGWQSSFKKKKEKKKEEDILDIFKCRLLQGKVSRYSMHLFATDTQQTSLKSSQSYVPLTTTYMPTHMVIQLVFQASLLAIYSFLPLMGLILESNF